MSDDIREWAKTQGYDVGERGAIAADIRKAYQAREEKADAFPAEDSPGPDTPPVEGTVTEVAPKQPTFADRVSDKISTAKKRTRTIKSKPPAKAKGPRVSIEGILTGAYGAGAAIVGKVNPAVGFIMGVQAPVAGMLMEDSVKGTAVDKLLQPLAKNADRARVGRALLGPPVLVAAIQAQPDKAPFLIPILRKMLADYIDLAGPKIVEIQKREAQFEEKYGSEVDEILNRLVGIINAQNGQQTNPETVEE